MNIRNLKKKHVLMGAILFILVPVFTHADIIVLKNGKKIRTEEAWEEDGQVKCYRFGQIMGYPKNIVKHVEKEQAAPVPKNSASRKENGKTPETPPNENATQKSPAEEAYHMICSDAFSREAHIEAKNKLEFAHQLNPQDPWISLTTTMMTLHHGYKIGDWCDETSFVPGTIDRAIQVADECIRTSPWFAKGFAMLGRLYMTKGNYMKAQDYLDTAYRLNPKDYNFWSYYAKLQMKQGNFQQAEEAMDTALECAEYNYQADVINGNKRDLARLTNNPDEEERLHIEKVLNNQDSAYAYGNYGNFLMRHDRYEEAIENYEKAVRIGAYPAVIENLKRAKTIMTLDKVVKIRRKKS